MKKLLGIFLSAIMMTSGITACAAENDGNRQADGMKITLQIDNPIMTVNGESMEIDEGRGTAPTIMNARTLVPIRAIIEAMGGKAAWDDETQTVILALGDDIITLAINNTTAFINETKHTLDVAPVTINERTMLPIRFIAEGFNFDVEWDEENLSVTITQ